MERFWTWSGRYVGVRQQDYLVASDGRVLGKFWEKDIYNQDGFYIGELGRENRLMKRLSKEGHRRPAFSYGVRGIITEAMCDIPPFPLIYGFEDFLF